MKATKAVIYTKTPPYLGEALSFGTFYVRPLLPDGSLPKERYGTSGILVFISIEHLALHLIENDLEPIKIPNEEGWPDEIQDLDEAHWTALNELLFEKPEAPQLNP